MPLAGCALVWTRGEGRYAGRIGINLRWIQAGLTAEDLARSEAGAGPAWRCAASALRHCGEITERKSKAAQRQRDLARFGRNPRG